MAISLWVTREQITVELQRRGRIDRIKAILLQDGLEQYDPPTAFALLQKKIETSGADHIACDAIDRDPMRDRLLRLSDSAIALKVYGGAAEEVQEADLS